MAGDITKRKEAEEALKFQKGLLESLSDAALDGILSISTEGRVLSFNRRFLELWQLPPESVSARSGKAVHRALIEKLAKPEVYLNWVQCLYALPREKKLEELLLKDGRTFDCYSAPIQGPAGERSYGRVWFYRDVSERKRAEKLKAELEDQFRQAQKMEAVGRLAGGVAHDFNNLLTAISGYGEVILGAVAPNDPLRAAAEEILKASDRASALTRQLLAFSRKQILRPQVSDVNALVRDMDGMLRRLIGDDIEFSTIAGSATSAVRCDPTQIQQVIMNLVVNARDAMPQGGKVTIETRDSWLDEKFAQREPDVRCGPYVALSVSDTGCGIPAEHLPHIFEPFFTTKGPGKGTGLGLSTVYGIVKQSGGHIFLQSEPGEGTTFRVYLPVADEPAVSAPARSGEPGRRMGNGELILVVEDSDLVRKLVREALLTAGYTVVEARSGAEAIRICEEQQGRVRLLLTDIVMPEMDGRQLVERLSPGFPGMKVAFMSGYADDALERHGFQTAAFPFIAKPFTLERLRAVVHEVLAGRKSPGGA